MCGGNHYSSECPRMKGRGGKGINGVDGQGEASKDESVELGGGKGEVSSNEWNYENEIDYGNIWNYSMDYDSSEYSKPLNPNEKPSSSKTRQ